VRLLFSVPATNDRGPKFLEKAAAAIHQVLPVRNEVVLGYGDHDGRVGLFLSFPNELEQIVTLPLISNYPQCVLSPLPEPEIPGGWATCRVNISLTPDLFPILRHAQFEDLANRSFADPIDGLLGIADCFIAYSSEAKPEA
jgi:hypothetical protein